MNSPRISVIIPVYNSEKFLRESISSILNQTYTDFELLIGDDGSTDGSPAIISSYRDKRIILVKNNKNEGIAFTLNRLIGVSRGEYIAVQHSDDISLPSRIEKQLRFLEKNPGIGLCGSNVSVFGDKKRRTYFPQNDEEIKAFMIFNNPFIHPAMMFKRSLFGNASLRYNQAFFPSEDYDLWFRLSLKTRLANIPGRLVHYRWHENNASQLKENHLLEKAKEIRKDILLRTLSYKITVQEAHVLNLSSTSALQNCTELGLFEAFLVKLLAQNDKTGYYRREAIQKLFFHFWVSACYKSKNINPLKKAHIFFGSRLFSIFQLFGLLTRRNLQATASKFLYPATKS